MGAVDTTAPFCYVFGKNNFANSDAESTASDRFCPYFKRIQDEREKRNRRER